MRKFIAGLMVGLGMVTTCCATDADILFDRLYTRYSTIGSERMGVDGSNAASFSASQRPDGGWDDIDYGVPERVHFDRILEMAVAFSRKDGAHFQSPALKKGILDGLDYWYRIFPDPPVSGSGWPNMIARQQRLGPIAVLMKSHLNDHLKQKIYLDLYRQPYSLGVNLVHHSEIMIWAGLLMDKEEDLLTGLHHLKSTLVVMPGDDLGIKADGSYWHHGRQMYTMAYGLGFARECSFWGCQLKGLSYAYSPEQTKVLSDYVLNHLQWLAFNGYADFPATGRLMIRPDSLQRKSTLLLVAQYMKGFDNANADAYDAMIRHQDAAQNLVGNRHYWRSDYTAHHRKNYHVGVKISSKRTSIQEGALSVGYNHHGYYLSMGGMVLAAHGDEISDIWPAWDWARIPGTTSRYIDDVPAPEHLSGTSSFAGGASDGLYSVTGFDQDWDGTQAGKSWFMFDKLVVALGSGIRSASPDPITTTLNQAYLKGEVLVEYNGGPGDVVEAGVHALKNPRWVLHNDIGYLFPEDSTVHLMARPQSGSWQYAYVVGSPDLVTENVFTLFLDHGTKPDGAAYAYILAPAASRQSMQELAEENPVKIIRNDEAVQAVYHRALQMGGAVFYEPGRVTFSTGLTVSVDRRCILLLKGGGDNPDQITVADPENLSGTLTVTLDSAGSESRTIVFALPEGEFAGSSITRSVEM